MPREPRRLNVARNLERTACRRGRPTRARISQSSKWRLSQQRRLVHCHGRDFGSDRVCLPHGACRTKPMEASRTTITGVRIDHPAPSKASAAILAGAFFCCVVPNHFVRQAPHAAGRAYLEHPDEAQFSVEVAPGRVLALSGTRLTDRDATLLRVFLDQKDSLESEPSSRRLGTSNTLWRADGAPRLSPGNPLLSGEPVIGSTGSTATRTSSQAAFPFLGTPESRAPNVSTAMEL